MKQQERIACFRDTLARSASEELRAQTERAIASTKVYPESFQCAENKRCLFRNATRVRVVEGTSFAVAKRYLARGRTAVLNFANPHYAGGGVTQGAMAQEECLCRSSNLYPCLSSRTAQTEYYAYHQRIPGYLFSDRVIYTEGVTVFKTDDPVPELMPESEWFTVSVLTCAAPYMRDGVTMDASALKELFMRRIQNIFETAMANDIDVLILGAFGCGAFGNPPEIVAEAFRAVMAQNRYRSRFEAIIFAIKSSARKAGQACPNLTAFRRVFPENCPEELVGKRLKAPSGRILAGKILSRYADWVRTSPYSGKRFSVLGDSISTLAGYNPPDYRVFFEGTNCDSAQVRELRDTWWGQVIYFLGGKLLVNNSWSGSRVTQLPEYPRGGYGAYPEQLFPSACSDERTGGLHTQDAMPDVILVYMGTNDWAFGAKLQQTGARVLPDHHCFDEAYERMLGELRRNYPKAEIWCCTLCPTFLSRDPSFQFPVVLQGNDMRAYNKIIRDAARQHSCRLIDLYACGTPYDSIDGSHPNRSGMSTLATLVLRAMGGADCAQFLDCEHDAHDYQPTLEYEEANAVHTRYVCTKCGRCVDTTRYTK